MSASDYCTQILAVSCLFIDQEDLPISICQALKNDLDSCLLAGCCTHFPDYSKLQVDTTTHQCKALHEMLQAAIRAKMEYTNIRTIAASEASGTGQAFSTQVNASQAEKTISQYKSGDEGSHKSGSMASRDMTFFIAMGVADLTLGGPLRAVFMSFDAPTLATQGFTRMQRRPLNASAISGRRSSRTSRRTRILPPPTTVTSMKQARSTSSSRYFSPYPLSPMPTVSVHQSLASMVVLLLLLLALDMVVAANLLFSCTTSKCCKL